MRDGDPNTTRRIEALEAELAALRSHIDSQAWRQPQIGFPRDRWIGRTTANGESYPTEASGADTFCVKLLSAAFNPITPGGSAVVERERGTVVVARTWPARYIPEDTEVIVDRIRGVQRLGEWWIAGGSTPEVRWGRTTSTEAVDYPELSRDDGVTRALPIYQVELGRLDYTWPADEMIVLGHGPLTADSKIDPAICRFIVDAPQQLVQAVSLLGDLHEGQPVLLTNANGRWVIVGPQQAVETRERLSFAGGYDEASSAYQSWIKAGNRLSLDLQSMYGIGGVGSEPFSSWHDIRGLTQSSFSSPCARVTRRGDYLVILMWRPKPYQYLYMTGSYDADEAQTLTGETIETTTTSGHSHYVDVRNQYWLTWGVSLELEVSSSVYDRGTSTVLSDASMLCYDEPLGEWRTAVGMATLNKGDELRLLLSVSDDEYNDGRLTHRGVSVADEVQLTIARLPPGCAWIP